MNIKENTLSKHRKLVDELIEQRKYKDALEISSKYPIGLKNSKTYVITKMRLLSKYVIKPKDLETLSSISKPNPHYKSSNPMILFLEDEVSHKFKVNPKYI